MNYAAKTRTPGSEVRLLKRELFAHLGYQPHPGQTLVHRSRAPRRVLACGVRWGKSMCASMEAVAALMKPAESSVGWIVAPNYGLCDRVFLNVLDTIRKHIGHRLVETNPREHRVVVRNLGGGLSEMRAKSADNPVSLLGEGLDWLIIDEATRVNQQVWEQHLSQRLIDRAGWALFLSTPRGCDWFYRLYKRCIKGLDEDYEGWQFPSWQSPLVGKDVVEAERARLPADVFAQEYAAEFLGWEDEPCESCGGIREESRGCVLVEEEEFDTLPRCQECGLLIDERGVPFGMRHEGRTVPAKVIILCQSRANPLPSPTTRALQL